MTKAGNEQHAINNAIKIFGARLDKGQPIGVRLDKRNYFTRAFGCNHCPHRSKSSCPYGATYSKPHSNGICGFRVEEVVINSRLVGTTSGKRIRLQDGMNHLADTIVELRNNLSDYRAKKEELLEEGKLKVKLDKDGDVVDPLQFDKLDEYEDKIMSRIDNLTTRLTEMFMKDVQHEEGTKSVTVHATPQDMTNMISAAAKRVSMVGSNKPKQLEKEE